MYTKEETLNLANLGDGAAVELFEAELNKVLKNIMDPNTDAKQSRSITMKVTFKPDENRDLATVDLSVGSRLSGSKAFLTKVLFGKDVRGKVEVREFENNQPSMFEKGKVIPIGERSE